MRFSHALRDKLNWSNIIYILYAFQDSELTATPERLLMAELLIRDLKIAMVLEYIKKKNFYQEKKFDPDEPIFMESKVDPKSTKT